MLNKLWGIVLPGVTAAHTAATLLVSSVPQPAKAELYSAGILCKSFLLDC